MSDGGLSGSEPSYFRLGWWLLYAGFAVIFVVTVAFVFKKWPELPTSVRAAMFIPIASFGFLGLGILRCMVGVDAFLFDHPVSCRGVDSVLEVRGLFSEATVRPSDVVRQRRFFGWVFVDAKIFGRTRRLWFAPWFENRSEVLKVFPH